MGNRESTADTAEFWNDVWHTADLSDEGHDDMLESIVSGLAPGRALDLGCGAGGNVVWLAKHGWQATGVDFSEVAVRKARELVAKHGLDATFVAADASTYQPESQPQLITSFYIQLPPHQRIRMLSNAAASLAPGGKLVFVSHDVSTPPSGWNADELDSLTTPDEIVAELPGLQIERAEVMDEVGAHMTHMPNSDEDENHERERHEAQPSEHSEEEGHHSHSHGGSTVIVAMKPLD